MHLIGTVIAIAVTTPPQLISRSGEPMKLVTAIIKPFKLDEVREALSLIGV